MQNPNLPQNSQLYPQLNYAPHTPQTYTTQVPQNYVPQAYYPYQQPMVIPNAAPEMYPKTQIELVNPYAPQPPIIQQVPGIINKTGFQKLDEQTCILIKQKLEFIEAVIGCETENRYNVYSFDQANNKQGRQIFKCKEKSNLCARWCLSGDCRPFDMTISTLMRGPEEDTYEPFLHLERPCKWTCLCFNRPYVNVTMVEGGRNEYLGKIVDPWNWCDMEFKIYDTENKHKYSIDGSCCQLGVWCRWPCEPCQTVDFNVTTASGEKISNLQKRSAGCLKSALTDLDNFVLKFPENVTVTDKALLMSAVLFLDFRHFETNPQENNN